MSDSRYTPTERQVREAWVEFHATSKHPEAERAYGRFIAQVRTDAADEVAQRVRAVLSDPSVGSWTRFYDIDKAIRDALDSTE